jgi:tetratricopeptide (TPR) repeat protein
MNSEELYELATNAVRRNQFKQAKGYFVKAIAKDPGNTKVWQGLRTVSTKEYDGKAMAAVMGGLSTLIQIFINKLKKNHEDGIVACARFICLNPKHIWTLKQLLAFGELGELDSLQAFAHQTMAEVDPENEDLALEAADFLSDTGDLELYEKAVQIMAVLCEAYPDDTDLSGERNRIEAKKVVNKLSSAENKTDVLKDKDAAKKLEEESQQIRTADDLENAIERAIGREKADPGDPRSKEVLADLLARRGDFDDAIAKYDEAIAIDPNNQNAQNRRGDAAIKKVESQISVMEKKAKSKSGEEAEALKGRIKAHKKKLRETKLAEYTRRLKVNPNDLNTRFELGTLYFNAKSFDKAISEFQRAVQDARLAFRSNVYLGHCFKQRKLYDMAIKEFTNASKRSGGSKTDKLNVQYEIALCYENAEKKAEALDVYKSILEKDFGFRDVAQRVETLS